MLYSVKLLMMEKTIIFAVYNINYHFVCPKYHKDIGLRCSQVRRRSDQGNGDSA